MGIFDRLFGRKPAPTQLDNLQKQLTALEQQVNTPVNEVGPRGFYTGYRTDLSLEPPNRLLSATELRSVYKESSIIRKCVDVIAHVISTLDWTVEDLQGNVVENETINSLFRKENLAGETFQDICSSVVTDLLVVNKGASYIARSPLGSVKQLYSRDGASIRPRKDETGILLGFQQLITQMPTFGGFTSAAASVPYARQDLIWLDLFPKTYVEAGEPLIEAIANEVASLLRGYERLAFYARKGQLPAAVLHLGQIAKEAAERARTHFKEQGATEGLAVIDNVDKVGIIPLDGTPLSADLQSFLQRAERTILRLFGIIPPDEADAGLSEDFVGALARRSELIRPAAILLATKITCAVGDAIGGKFQFTQFPIVGPRDLVVMVRGGVITPNEARKVLGRPPKEGGDKLFMVEPRGISDLAGLIPGGATGQPSPTAALVGLDEEASSEEEDDETQQSRAQRDTLDICAPFIREDSLSRDIINISEHNLVPAPPEPPDSSRPIVWPKSTGPFSGPQGLTTPMPSFTPRDPYAQGFSFEPYSGQYHQLPSMKVMQDVNIRNYAFARSKIVERFRWGLQNTYKDFYSNYYASVTDFSELIGTAYKNTSTSLEKIAKEIAKAEHSLTIIPDVFPEAKAIKEMAIEKRILQLNKDAVTHREYFLTFYEQRRKQFASRTEGLRRKFFSTMRYNYNMEAKDIVAAGARKAAAQLGIRKLPLPKEDLTFLTSKYLNTEMKYFRDKFAPAQASIRKLFSPIIDVNEAANVTGIRSKLLQELDGFSLILSDFSQGLSSFGEIPIVVATKALNIAAKKILAPGEVAQKEILLFWTGSDDLHSCEHCSRYTGQTFTDTDFTPTGPYPRPQMWLNEDYGLRCRERCRCTLTPIAAEGIISSKSLGRSFINRMLPFDELFTLDRVKALFGIRTDTNISKLVQTFAGLRQTAYWLGVDSAQIVTAAEDAVIRSTVKGTDWVSRFSYVAPNGNLAILIPSELSQAQQARELSGELARSLYRNNLSTLPRVHLETIQAMQTALRNEQFDLVADGVTQSELTSFLDYGILSEKGVKQVGKLLPDPIGVYSDPFKFFRYFFQEMSLDTARFETRKIAAPFKSLVSSYSWDVTPRKTFLNLQRRSPINYVHGNLSAMEAERLYKDWMRKVPARNRDTASVLLKQILQTPGLLRREYYYNFVGEPTPTYILPMDAKIASKIPSFKGVPSLWFGNVEHGGWVPKAAARDEMLKYMVDAEPTWAAQIINVQEGWLGDAVILCSPTVSSFAHELGHNIWHYSISAGDRAAFSAVHRTAVIATRMRLEEVATYTRALKVLSAKERGIYNDTLKLLSAIEKGTLIAESSQAGARELYQNLTTLTRAFDAAGLHIPLPFRPYSIAYRNEFFSDMFMRLTVMPETYRLIDPRIAKIFETQFRTRVLRESLPSLDKALLSTIKEDDFILNFLSGAESLSYDQLGEVEELVIRMLAGEFGNLSLEAFDALVKRFDISSAIAQKYRRRLQY